MKKKAVSVLLAISMLAAGMMGCGKQAATDSTGLRRKHRPHRLPKVRRLRIQGLHPALWKLNL